jgi:hypothetical protein
MQDFVSARIEVPVDARLEAVKADVFRAATVQDPVKELIDLHQKRVLRLLSNRMIQFVDQVAGNLGMDFSELLRSIHKDFDRFLKPGGRNPCDEVIASIRKLAPGLKPEELERIENYSVSAGRLRDSSSALLEVVTLPMLLAKEMFVSVLSAGVRSALYELGIAVRLEYSQAEVFHYLIWNVKWMPAFAKLVSELIIVQRKKTQISTSKVILDSANKAVYFALLDFGTFRMWDGSEMYRELVVDEPDEEPRGRLPIKRIPSPLFEPDEEFVPNPAPKGSFHGRSRSPAGATISEIERRFNGPQLYRADLEERYGDLDV